MVPQIQMKKKSQEGFRDSFGAVREKLGDGFGSGRSINATGKFQAGRFGGPHEQGSYKKSGLRGIILPED